MYESKDKMVSHPNHYEIMSGVEVIDIIEAVTADMKGVEATDTANIIKYACRWKKKNGIQDLEKLIWYATHLVEYLRRPENLSQTSNNHVASSITFPVFLGSKKDVEEVINCIKDLIYKYGYASIGDLYEVTDNSANQKEICDYGWTDISSARVKSLENGGYLLLLPKATSL